MVFGRDQAQEAGGWTRAAVASRLPKHQDELNVILDEPIRLVGLAEIRSIFVRNFGLQVTDLMPNDRRKIVKANFRAAILN